MHYNTHALQESFMGSQHDSTSAFEVIWWVSILQFQTSATPSFPPYLLVPELYDALHVFPAAFPACTGWRTPNVGSMWFMRRMTLLQLCWKGC
jgi:hypothetical protein